MQKAISPLGEMIDAKMVELGMKQAELATHWGLSESQLSLLRSGDRGSAMSLKTAVKLSRGLSVSVDTLLTLGEEDEVRTTGVATPGKATSTSS